MEKFFDGERFPVNINAKYYVWGNNKYEKLSFGRTGWKTETFVRPSARRDYYSVGSTVITAKEAEELISKSTRMTLGGVDWLID